MMKRFEQFNFDEYFKKEKPSQEHSLEKFYNEYKRLFDNDIEFEQEDEPLNIDIFTEVGQLVNKYHLSKDDVKWILDNEDTSFDTYRFLESTYDDWNKFDEKFSRELYNSIKNSSSYEEALRHYHEYMD